MTVLAGDTFVLEQGQSPYWLHTLLYLTYRLVLGTELPCGNIPLIVVLVQESDVCSLSPKIILKYELRVSDPNDKRKISIRKMLVE